MLLSAGPACTCTQVTFDAEDDLEGASPPKRLCPASTVNFAAVFAELLPHSQLMAAEKCGIALASQLIARYSYTAPVGASLGETLCIVH